jgi:hypothetical protein
MRFDHGPQRWFVRLHVGRIGLVQFALVKHWTQVSVAGSQRVEVPRPMQFALIKHWTQRFVVVLQ